MALTGVQKFQLVVNLLVVFLECSLVDGHAKMTEPPMRSSMWRFGFDTPVNYDDNELFCGGIQRFMKNNGRCGTCGDPYDDPHPEHEAGGKFATGTIVRYYPRYTTSIPITIDVTAHHKGFFEFRLCAHNNVHTRVSQQCLDQNLLVIEEGERRGHPYRFFPKDNGLWNVTVRIPPDIMCTQCVLQMRYKAGNSWGLDPKDPDRGPCIGCGVQEEFRNCADISIGHPEPPSTTVASVTKTDTNAGSDSKQRNKSKQQVHHRSHKQRHNSMHAYANTGRRKSKDVDINKIDKPYAQIHKDRKDTLVKNEKKDFNFRVRRIEEALLLLDDTERVLSGLERNFDENPINKKMSGLQYVKVYSGLVWTKRKIRHLEKLINKIVSKLYVAVNARKNIAGSPEDQGVYMSEYEAKNSLIKSKVRIDNKTPSKERNGVGNPSGQKSKHTELVRKLTTNAVRYTTNRNVKSKEELNHYSLTNAKTRGTDPVEQNDARYTKIVRNIKSNVTERPVTLNTRARKRGKFITASDTNRDKYFMTVTNKKDNSSTEHRNAKVDSKTLLANKFPALGSWGNKYTQKGINIKGAKSKSSPVLAPNAMPWSPPVQSSSTNTSSNSSYTRSGTTSKLFQTRTITHPTMKPAVQSRSKFSAGVATSKSTRTNSKNSPQKNKNGHNSIKLQRTKKTTTIVKPNDRTERKDSSKSGELFNAKIKERSKTSAKKYHTDKKTGFKVADSNVIQKEIMPTLNALGLAAGSRLAKQTALPVLNANSLPPRLKNYALSKWMRAEIRNRILHKEYLQSALAEHSRNENSVIKAA